MTVGPLGRGGAGAGSTVTKSLAMGAVYESTGIGNWFTIFPAGFTPKSPHGTSFSPTSAAAARPNVLHAARIVVRRVGRGFRAVSAARSTAARRCGGGSVALAY